MASQRIDDMHVNHPRTEWRRFCRPLAAVALLVALAGCGRGTPEAAVFRDAAELAAGTTVPPPATTTTTAPLPTTTTTTPARPAARLAEAKPTTTVAAVRGTTTTAAPVPGAVSHGGPVRDQVSLIDNLRGSGLTVVPVSSVNQPFLGAPGTVLSISGPKIAATQVQAFDYASPEAAAADASTVRPDGGGTTSAGNWPNATIEWIGTPHMYLRARVLVIYVGSDPAVTSVLTELLGPQFAGR